jgi:hypothetical protein
MPAAALRPAPDAANPAGIVVRNARIYAADRAQPTRFSRGHIRRRVHGGRRRCGRRRANARIVDGRSRRVIPG